MGRLLKDNATLKRISQKIDKYKDTLLKNKRDNKKAYETLEKDYEDIMNEKKEEILRNPKESEPEEFKLKRGFWYKICPCLYKKTEDEIRENLKGKFNSIDEIEVIIDMRRELKNDI